MTPRAVAIKTIEIMGNREFITKAVGALIFFLVALFLFISLRFPTKDLAPFIEQAIRESAKPLKVSIGDVERAFPLGIKASGVNIVEVTPIKNRPLFDIDSVTFRPSLLSLVTGGVGGVGSVEFLGGTADFDGETDDYNNMSFQIDFSDVETGDVAAWDDFIWAKLAGKLAGNGDISIQEGDILKSDGSLDASLSNGTLFINKALVSGLKPAKIDGGEFVAILNKGRITISRFIINGPQISIEGGGDIILNKNPRLSILNLKFSFSLSGKLGEKLSPFLSTLKTGGDGKKILKVGGTFGRPKIS